jgi:predicted nicotinamide N-methyase
MQWPGGCALTNFVVQRLENDSTTSTILELGAGTGTTALEASRFCKHAVLTDGNPHAVSEIVKTAETLASSSLLLQDLNSHDEFAGVSIEAMELMWGDEQHIAALHGRFPEGFDLIVAGDVIYGSWKSHLDAILSTVDPLLGHGDGCCFILVGCIKRVDGDVNAVVRYIAETALDYGLIMTKHEEAEPLSMDIVSTGFNAGKGTRGADNERGGSILPRPWENGQRSWRDEHTWRQDYHSLGGTLLLFTRAPGSGE